jgi:hypothetical protein
LRLEQLSWQMRDSLDRTLDQAVRDVSLLSTLSETHAGSDRAKVRQVLENLSWEWARTLANGLLTPALRGYGAEIVVVRRDGIVLLGPEAMLEMPIATESLAMPRAGRRSCGRGGPAGAAPRRAAQGPRQRHRRPRTRVGELHSASEQFS